MDQTIKLALAKILGEIYRIQKRLPEDICSVNDSTIFGLLNGMENVIDAQLGNLEFISNRQIEHVSNILNRYHLDQNELNNFTGFYEIEYELEAGGVDRMTAIQIITMFNAENRFTEVIQRMDTIGSPGECRRFNIPSYDC